MLGSALKKSLRASEQDRPDVARRRQQWKQHQDKVDPKRLVFIDETWVKTNMTRTHGRCPRGQRLIAKVPYGHWKTLTFVAALRCDGIVAPCVLRQPVNAISFLAWVTQFLVPTLRPGDVVIMDNLSSHKRQAIRAAIRAGGDVRAGIAGRYPDARGAALQPRQHLGGHGVDQCDLGNVGVEPGALERPRAR